MEMEQVKRTRAIYLPLSNKEKRILEKHAKKRQVTQRQLLRMLISQMAEEKGLI